MQKKTSRVQSQYDREVWISPWDCPIGKDKRLSFCGMIEIIDIRFFFLGEKTVYVLSLQRTSPFRVIEEGYMGAFGELFKFAPADRKKLPKTRCHKIWGTPFIKELNSQSLLFFDSSEEKKFEYSIATEDEWIQFITLKPVQIDVIPGRSFVKVMEKYIGKDLKELKKK